MHIVTTCDRRKEYIVAGEVNLGGNVFAFSDKDLLTNDNSDRLKELFDTSSEISSRQRERRLSLQQEIRLGRTTWSCEDNQMLSGDGICIDTHYPPMQSVADGHCTASPQRILTCSLRVPQWPMRSRQPP